MPPIYITKLKYLRLTPFDLVPGSLAIGGATLTGHAGSAQDGNYNQSH